MDWENRVETFKLVCAATGEPLPPDQPFYSALVFADNVFVRYDYAPAAWESEAKDRFISWWRQKPPGAVDRPRTIDSEALLRIFVSLKDTTDRAQQCFLYVVVLFLARARKLRLRGIGQGDDADFVLVEDRVSGALYRVRDPRMSGDEEDAVQRNLLEIVELGGDDDAG